MDNIEKLGSFRSMFFASVLGLGILVSKVDFTFGEVCIVSIGFYCYLNLKQMIRELGNKEDE